MLPWGPLWGRLLGGLYRLSIYDKTVIEGIFQAFEKIARTLHDLRVPDNTALESTTAIASASSGKTRRNTMIKPSHPGEIIKEDYLLPLGIGTARLNEIVLGKRGITADTALRLARCFGTSAEFWLNLQSLYDLRMAARKAGGKIERAVKPLKLA
jgi:addiction module HigA family antidote